MGKKLKPSNPFSEPCRPAAIPYWLRPASPEEESLHRRLTNFLYQSETTHAIEESARRALPGHSTSDKRRIKKAKATKPTKNLDLRQSSELEAGEGCLPGPCYRGDDWDPAGRPEPGAPRWTR